MEDLRDLIPDFRLHLRATNKAPKTIASYVSIAEAFVAWLLTTNQPTTADVERSTLLTYFTHLQTSPTSKTGKPMSAASVAVAYRSLQQFFRWLADLEEIIPFSPFVKMSAPAVPEKPVPVISEAGLRKLLDSCKGRSFEDRRDEALIRLFLDTGCRCSEISTLKLQSLDFDMLTAPVMGKGRRPRVVPFGAKTAEALRRYIRVRRQHPKGESDCLWIGKKGEFTDFGIRQMLNRRTQAAGLPHIHPHMFRHTFAHTWLVNGGQEGDLRRIAGWRSREMLDRYGASAATERAQVAHHRMDLGGRY